MEMTTVVTILMRPRQSVIPSTVILTEDSAATTLSASLDGASVTRMTTAETVPMKIIMIFVCSLLTSYNIFLLHLIYTLYFSVPLIRLIRVVLVPVVI